MGIRYGDGPKQPGETIIYGMTFTPGDAIATGDTLTGSPTVVITRLSDSVVVTSDVVGPPAITGMLSGSASRSGNTVSAKIIGGTDGQSYKITYSCATTLGELVEEDFIFLAKEL